MFVVTVKLTSHQCCVSSLARLMLVHNARCDCKRPRATDSEELTPRQLQTSHYAKQFVKVTSQVWATCHVKRRFRRKIIRENAYEWTMQLGISPSYHSNFFSPWWIVTQRWPAVQIPQVSITEMWDYINIQTCSTTNALLGHRYNHNVRSFKIQFFSWADG